MTRPHFLRPNFLRSDVIRPDFTRRAFLKNSTSTVLGVTAGLALGGRQAWAASLADQIPQPPVPSSPAREKPVSLPPLTADSEQHGGRTLTPLPPDKRIGFAIVGLGKLAVEEILPAFGACELARPVALVSGHPDKAKRIASQYGIAESSIYNYENFDQIKNNPDIKVVYIVLPNSMHKEFTLRAAQAGKHVLCEKPMAISSLEAQHMTDGCEKLGRKLMIAYRQQYEPNNRILQKLARNRTFGKVQVIDACNGQMQGDPSQWRHKKALAGGGCLPDVGIYCLNACRFITGEEPSTVFGTAFSPAGDPRFKEVEANMIFQLKFPSGILANCATGYNFHESRRIRLQAEKGWFGMNPSFGYHGLKLEASYADGQLEQGIHPSLQEHDQFALEMDHMAECVILDRKPYSGGAEGHQDMKIIEAIYESVRIGAPVQLAEVHKLDSTRESVWDRK